MLFFNSDEWFQPLSEMGMELFLLFSAFKKITRNSYFGSFDPKVIDR